MAGVVVGETKQRPAPLNKTEIKPKREKLMRNLSNLFLFSQSPVNVRVNYWLIAFIAAATAASAAALYAVHLYQLKSFKVSLHEAAREAEAAGDRELFLKYLDRYTAHAPDDVEALAELAVESKRFAVTATDYTKAFFRLEAVCRADPDRHDVRRDLAETAIILSRYDDALIHLRQLRIIQPNDGELAYFSGRCLEEREHLTEAIEEYQTSIELLPEQLAAYARLSAVLYGPRENPEQAMRVLDQMIVANPSSARGLLVRCRLAQQLDDLERAVADLEAAWKLAPDDHDVLLAAADVVATDPDATDIGTADVYQGLEKLLAGEKPDAAVFSALVELDLSRGLIDSAERQLRSGLTLHAEDLNLCVRLAALLIDDGRLDEAEKQLEELQDADAPASVTRAASRTLAGYIHLKKSQWLDAVEVLDRVRGELEDQTLMRTWANLWLAEAHRELHNPQEEIDAYRRILEFNPDSKEARMGLSAALASRGQFQGALAYSRLSLDADTQQHLQIVRLLIQQNFQLPKQDRDWDQVEQALRTAEEKDPASPRIPVVRSRVLELKGQPKQARESLERMIQLQPEQMFYRTSLARLLLRRGDIAEAETVLDEAEELQVSDVDLLLTRVDWLSSLPATAAVRGELLELEKRLDALPEQDRISVLQRLAEFWTDRGEFATALEFERRVISLKPQNLAHHVVAFESALKAGNTDVTKALLEEIKNIQGENGAYWNACQALLKIHEAQVANDPSLLSAADPWIQRVERVEPNWSLLSVIRGTYNEFKGDNEAALRHYQDALERGSANPDLQLRILRILVVGGDYRRAHQEILRTQSIFPLTRLPLSLTAAIASVARHVGAFEEALAYCERWASLAPDSFHAYLTLGQCLNAVDRPADALEAFARSVELGGQTTTTWLALMEQAVLMGDTEYADRVMDRMRNKLSADEASFVLARFHQLTGDQEEADRCFEQAVAYRSEDSWMQWVAAAHFSQRGDRARAVKLYRGALNLEETERRTLAVQFKSEGYPVALKNRLVDPSKIRAQLAAVLSTGDYRDFQEAIRVLDGAVTRNNDHQLTTVKARILASRSQLTRHRQEAIKLFQQLRRAGQLIVTDQLLLARLLDKDGQTRSADQEWGLLAAENPDEPLVLVGLVDRSVENQDAAGAERWFRRLRGMEIGQSQLVAAAVKVAASSGRPDEAIRWVTVWVAAADDDATRERRLAVSAQLCDRVAFRLATTVDRGVLDHEVVRLYSELMRMNPRHGVEYAGFLARRERFAEAFEIATVAVGHASPVSVASTLLSLLRTGELTNEQAAHVTEFFHDLAGEDGGSVELLQRQAEFLHIQNDYESSEHLSRDILAVEPDNVRTLNNLAWSLALRGNAEEAERMIRHAIEVQGPLSALIDTQAVVLLSAGDPNAAIEILKKRRAEEKGGVRQFHLARAYHAAGNHAAASATLRQALAMELTLQDLDALERPAFKALTQELIPSLQNEDTLSKKQ